MRRSTTWPHFACAKRDIEGARRFTIVAQAADPDEIRDAIRDATLSKDVAALNAIADGEDYAETDPTTLWRLGLAYLTSRDLSRGLEVLERAHRFYPDHFRLNFTLAEVYRGSQQTAPGDPLHARRHRLVAGQRLHARRAGGAAGRYRRDGRSP